MSLFNLVTTTRPALPDRIILVGPPKEGKTTTAATFPRPIFLPMDKEEGHDALQGLASFPTIKSFKELIDYLGSLCSEKHIYQTVVIDSVSTLEPIIWSEVCNRNGYKTIAGDYGKGYMEALNYWNQILTALDYLRKQEIGCILIGHTKIKPVNDPLQPSYDSYVFDIHNTVSEKIMRWADATLFVKKEIFVREPEHGKAKALSSNNVWMYGKKHPSYPSGGRGAYGFLPDKIEPNYKALKIALEEAKKDMPKYEPDLGV